MQARVAEGGAERDGDIAEALRIQLLSRTGSRLLLRAAEGSPGEVRALARSIPFADFVRDRFEVEVSGGGARPRQLAGPVEEAVIRAVPGASPGGGQAIRVRLAEGRLSISIDASGEHLHRRGWRLETGAAPLRENLAAGILRLAGYSGEAPLLDPMCGSGTFVIEAAMLALGRLPSRRFACEDWPCFPAGLSESMRAELGAGQRDRPPQAIEGRDRNAGALGVARRNATRAGVAGAIRLARADALEASPPAGPPGLVVANLPYGKRVGERGELAELYEGLGAHLRERFAGWRAALLTGGGELASLLGPGKAIPLVNGGLDCELRMIDL